MALCTLPGYPICASAVPVLEPKANTLVGLHTAWEHVTVMWVLSKRSELLLKWKAVLLCHLFFSSI